MNHITYNCMNSSNKFCYEIQVLYSSMCMCVYKSPPNTSWLSGVAQAASNSIIHIPWTPNTSISYRQSHSGTKMFKHLKYLNWKTMLINKSKYWRGGGIKPPPSGSAGNPSGRVNKRAGNERCGREQQTRVPRRAINYYIQTNCNLQKFD